MNQKLMAEILIKLSGLIFIVRGLIQLAGYGGFYLFEAVQGKYELPDQTASVFIFSYIFTGSILILLGKKLSEMIQSESESKPFDKSAILFVIFPVMLIYLLSNEFLLFWQSITQYFTVKQFGIPNFSDTMQTQVITRSLYVGFFLLLIRFRHFILQKIDQFAS